MDALNEELLSESITVRDVTVGAEGYLWTMFRIFWEATAAVFLKNLSTHDHVSLIYSLHLHREMLVHFILVLFNINTAFIFTTHMSHRVTILAILY